MENLQVGIENDYGKIVAYNIDSDIIEGLYITVDSQKIRENCENFNIEITSWKDDSQDTKMSKRDNLVILTIKIDMNKIIQFLIGDDMNLKQMKLLSSKVLSQEMKKIIKECHILANTRSLSGLL